MDPHLPAPPLGLDQQNLRFRARRSPCLQETTPAGAAHWSGSAKPSLPRPAVALPPGNHTCRPRPLAWIIKTFASASAGRLACRKTHQPVLWVWISKTFKVTTAVCREQLENNWCGYMPCPSVCLPVCPYVSLSLLRLLVLLLLLLSLMLLLPPLLLLSLLS